jgi:hypothetical protein
MKLEVGQVVMARTNLTSWRHMTVLYIRSDEVVLREGDDDDDQRWYYAADKQDYGSSDPYFPITWIKPHVLKHNLEATV